MSRGFISLENEHARTDNKHFCTNWWRYSDVMYTVTVSVSYRADVTESFTVGSDTVKPS